MQTRSSSERQSRLAALLNSRGVPATQGLDQLTEPKAATKLLKLFAGDVGNQGSIDASIRKVRHIRTALLETLTNPHGRSGWEALNAISDGVHFTAIFQQGQSPRLTRRAGDAVIASILEDVIATMECGEWDRFKICSFDLCSTAFFDVTRSKTQRWCSYATCGNRSNVASHRARTS